MADAERQEQLQKDNARLKFYCYAAEMRLITLLEENRYLEHKLHELESKERNREVEEREIREAREAAAAAAAEAARKAAKAAMSSSQGPAATVTNVQRRPPRTGPRKYRSPFMFFKTTNWQRLKLKYGGAPTPTQTRAEWGGLSNEDRSRYETMATEDKARYERELAEYKASQVAGGEGGGLAPSAAVAAAAAAAASGGMPVARGQDRGAPSARNGAGGRGSSAAASSIPTSPARSSSPSSTVGAGDETGSFRFSSQSRLGTPGR